MLLLSKQWARILGAGILLLALLYYLNSAHAIAALSEHMYVAWEDSKNNRTQQQAYRPQDEVQGEPSSTKLRQAETVSSLNQATAPVSSLLAVESISKPGVAPTKGPSTTETVGNTGALQTSATTTGLRKAIVMGKLSEEDTSWVGELSDWENAVYVVDLPSNATSPTGYRTKINKAKEVTPYLTYIIEHYDNFPDIAVFVHAHRNGWPQAWHNDAPGYDAVEMVRLLQVQTVQDRGYVNLRCKLDVGCPREIILNRSPPDQTKHAEHAYPDVYGQFFNLSSQEVKEQISVVATPCCAQFSVSSAEVLKRPKSEYERYLTLVESSTYDDQTLGTVLEYMWHIMFGQDPVHCPKVNECYESVYGKPKKHVP